eukprot:7054360-Prymnesium_polylepis.1
MHPGYKVSKTAIPRGANDVLMLVLCGVAHLPNWACTTAQVAAAKNNAHPAAGRRPLALAAALLRPAPSPHGLRSPR